MRSEHLRGNTSIMTKSANRCATKNSTVMFTFCNLVIQATLVECDFLFFFGHLYEVYLKRKDSDLELFLFDDHMK